MNLVKSYHDYVHVYETNLDLEKLEDSCKKIKDYIVNGLTVQKTGEHNNRTFKAPITTRVYPDYNLTQFVLDQTHELYEVITRVSNKHITDWSTNWWVQCWLNWYEEGEFIHWHDHGATKPKSLHGFLCVHAKDSHTSYRLKDGTEFDVPSKDGNIIVTESDGDKHSTQPWKYQHPRITLAFDVVPEISIDAYKWQPNHWTPLLRLEK